MKPFRIQYIDARRDRLPPWAYNWRLYSGAIYLGSFPTPALAMDAVVIAIEASDDCKNLVAYKKARDKRTIRLAALVLTIEEGRWWTLTYWQARSHIPAMKQLVDDAELAIYKIKERLNQRYGAMNRDPS